MYASSNEMFIKFGELSLNALKVFIKENINKAFNDKKLLRLCTNVLNDVLKTHYNCKSSSSKQLTSGYYIEIGYSKKEAESIVIQIQRKRSKRCVEYWLDKGFSKEEAKHRIIELQRGYAKKSAERLSLDYWLKLGLSYEAAILKQKDYKLKIASSSEEHLKKINNLSDNEIVNIKQTRYNTRDPEICANRLNLSIEKAKTIVQNRIERSTCIGSKNGMYGRPSPLKTGAAYSGYYKDFYFRSFSEYCFIKLHENENIHSAEQCCKVNWRDGRTYRPDFIIDDTIYEIKSDYMLEHIETRLKIQALKEAFQQYKVILVAAKSIPKPSKDVVLNDLKCGALRIDDAKSDRFRLFMEKYK